MIIKLLSIIAVLCGCEAFTRNRLVGPAPKELFELSIVHFNDFHARFVETSITSGTCLQRNSSKCVGGVARLLTASRRLVAERPNAVFLNAGDFYQGSFWHSVHHWRANVYFMNKLRHDVVTIGNHDFDDGIEGLVPFLKEINAPVTVANIDDSQEPTIKGLYENSTIIQRGGRKIGVIGVVIATTKYISHTGKLKFFDEIESVSAEAARLKAKGIDIIIVLSHGGLDIDLKMAAVCSDIDVIVGGHSHTFLYTGTPPANDIPADEYPVVVKQSGIANRTVLIVQAAAFTKYLGNLTVWFDSAGEVAGWDGNPIFLDNNVEQDPEIIEELKPWEDAVKAVGLTEIGTSKSYLNYTNCLSEECSVANLITDAMVHAFVNKTDNPNPWTYVAISCINAGGLRASIPLGAVTFGDIATVQPFANTWDVVELKGEDLRTAIEESVATTDNKQRFRSASFIHWSGVRVVYDLNRPAYSRIVDVKVKCQDCSKPEFEELKNDKWYRVVVPSFVMKKGDNIRTIAEKQRNHVVGKLDTPQIVDYIKAISVDSVFEYDKDGRVILTGGCCN